MSAAELLAKLRATPPGYKRNELFEQIEKENGRGFMKSLRDQLESSELIEANEASIRRPKSRRRR
jgi:hypothetical protein